MAKDIAAQFHDPSTVATSLGESVGTHYSAALRAAEAYGKHLAAEREALLVGTFEGKNLEDFWRDLLTSEQLRVGSSQVLKGLSTEPSHYFADFLDTADDVYRRRYGDVQGPRKKKSTQTEHARCLRLLRDHTAEGMKDHFTVQNKIATWMRMIRLLGGYQE